MLLSGYWSPATDALMETLWILKCSALFSVTELNTSLSCSYRPTATHGPIYCPHSLLMTNTTSSLTPEVTGATGHRSAPPLAPLSVEVRISPPAGPEVRVQSAFHHRSHLRSLGHHMHRVILSTEKKMINLLLHFSNGLIYSEWWN